MRILIADDELRLRKVVAMFLKKNGYEITEVSNGVQALEALEAGHYDVIILDVVMPIMGGMEACRQIKSDSRFKNIPVILLTASISTTDRNEGLAAGAYAYVTKPFSPKILLEKIQDAASDHM